MDADCDPTEAGRRAAAVNHLLEQIGLTAPEQTRWWDYVAYDELGGRTVTQAWLAGDVDGVTALVDRWYAASERAARQAASDPKRLGELRAHLASLEERTANRRLPA